MPDKFNIDPGVQRAPNLMPSAGGVGGNPGNPVSGLTSLFEGAGSLFAGIQNRNNQAQLTNINREVSANQIMPGTVDRLPGANPDASTTPTGSVMGTGQPQEGSAVPQEDLPSHIKSGLNRSDVTYQSYKQGRLGEEHYTNMISVQMRDMIAKNPAYAKEIEKAYEIQYGFNPNKKANETLFAAQNKKEAELKDEDKRWRETKAEASTLGIPADQLLAGDNNPSYRAKVEARLLDIKATNASRDQKLKAIELKEKEGKDVSSDYYRNANEAIGQTVTNFFSSTFESMEVSGGVSMKKLSEAKTAALADGIVSPQERAQLSGMVDQLELHFNNQLNTTLNPYFAKINDPGKIAELKKYGTDQFDVYRKNILEGRTGILNANEENLKAAKSGDAIAVQQQSEEMRRVGAAQTIGGDAAVNIMVTQRATQIKDDVARIRLLPIARDITEGKPLSEAIANRSQNLSKEGSAQLADQAIKGAQGVILDPKTSPEVLSNTVKSLFGDRNSNLVDNFTPNSRSRVFATLASPAMTLKMQELGKTDPKALEDYKAWSLRTFNGMMTTHTANLKDTFSNGGANSAAQNSKAFKIGFDGNQFTVALDPKIGQMDSEGRVTQKSQLGGAFQDNVNNVQSLPAAMKNTIESVREMNRALSILRPILEEGKEGDLTKILDPILAGIGVSGEVKNDLAYVAKAYSDWKLSEADLDKAVGKESNLPATKGGTVAENPRTALNNETPNVADPNYQDQMSAGGFTQEMTKNGNGPVPVLGPRPESEWGTPTVVAPDPVVPSENPQEQTKIGDATPVAKTTTKAAGGAPQAQQTPTVVRKASNPLGLKVQTETEANNNPMSASYIMPTDGSYTPQDVLSQAIQSTTGGRGVADSNYPDLMNYMRKTKGAESGGNVSAQNPKSSARGLYQFTAATWNRLSAANPELGLTPTGRDDPRQQEKAMAVFTRENEGILRKNGVPINDGSRYLAHFAGSGGAVKLYKADPNASVASILGSNVVAANPFLKGKSAAWTINWAAKKMGEKPVVEKTQSEGSSLAKSLIGDQYGKALSDTKGTKEEPSLLDKPGNAMGVIEKERNAYNTPLYQKNERKGSKKVLRYLEEEYSLLNKETSPDAFMKEAKLNAIKDGIQSQKLQIKLFGSRD